MPGESLPASEPEDDQTDRPVGARRTRLRRRSAASPAADGDRRRARPAGATARPPRWPRFPTAQLEADLATLEKPFLAPRRAGGRPRAAAGSGCAWRS